MKYTYLDRKFEFSPRAKQALEDSLTFFHGWDDREETFTGPDFDGKTPFLDVFEEMPDAPYSECLAHGIVRSWTTSEITVRPYEVIVGNYRPLRRFSEHYSFGISDWDDMLDYHDHGNLAMRDSIQKRVDALQGRMWPATIDIMHEEGDRILGEEVYRRGWSAGLGGCGGYQGHTVPGYPTLLEYGIDGLLDRISSYEANTTDEGKLEFYKAQRIILEGLSAYAMLHADAARSLAEAEADQWQRARYLLIAENCESVAHKAPETLLEAVQLKWFFGLWDWVDCFGRLDQTLYPFYIASDDSAVSREDIMCDFLTKLRRHGSHNVTLGGVIPKTGKDAANELTYLILQILRTAHDVHPRISLRIHDDSPAELLDLLVKMWSEGMSDPTIVSDTLVIDGLRRYGVSLVDARDYTMLGCQEIEIPGKSNFGCEDGTFNLAKVLEYALNDGYDVKTGIRVGLPTGPLTDFKSVEEVWDAFVQQLRHVTPTFLHLCDVGQTVRDRNLAKLVKSVITDDCTARGINQDAGGAKYNYGVIETAGLAVVADSFAALESLVFCDEPKVSLRELASAMAKNYEGYDELRAILLDAPKFGNDIDSVDRWATRTLQLFWGDLAGYRSIRGGAYMGACSLQGGGRGFGNQTWALPDGHRMGDPLGNTIGPRTGADKMGLTAMLNSIMKLPLHLGLGGTTVNTRIPITSTASEEQRAKIAGVVRTYMKHGGQMAQITTATLEDLIDAKAHPHDHFDLIVRVGGFSNRFVELIPESQDEMIARFAGDGGAI
ncbi:MAG: hypothetical protein IJO81_06365 [Clostridia bacterium]|nr:hypothetical protein [Clostridia bacterium]